MAISLWCIACGVENRQTRAIGENEDGDQACGPHGGKMDWKTKLDSHFGIEKPVVKAEPASYTKIADFHAMGLRYCTFEGCGKKLRSDNHTDLCKTHRYVKKNAERKKQQQSLRQDAFKTIVDVVTDPRPETKAVFVNLKVSEAFLDGLWGRMTPEQKARALETMNCYNPVPGFDPPGDFTDE